MSDVEIIFKDHGVLGGGEQIHHEETVLVPLSDLENLNGSEEYDGFIEKVFLENDLTSKFNLAEVGPLVSYEIIAAGDRDLHSGIIDRISGKKIFPKF